jgi:ABC-type nitrate/sulfonate/bicarbonate transport system permease component
VNFPVRNGSTKREVANGEKKWLNRLYSFLLLIVILVVWQLASSAGYINKFYLSSPIDIVAAAWQIVASGQFLDNLGTTAYTYALGVFLGVVTGAVLGLAMGWWRKFGEIADPYIVFFSAMPRIALYPVLMMIFGAGELSRVLIVFVGVLFPVLFNAMSGAKQTPKVLIDAARVFGYKDQQLFYKVVLPAALPYLMAGVRNGITLGMILVVVAEFFGASSGLGQQISLTAQMFQTPNMYAWVIFTSLLALICVRLADFVERKILHWS